MKIILFFLIITLSTAFPSVVKAQQPNGDGAWGGSASELFPQIDPLEGRLSTPGEVVSKLIPPLLTLAGVIMFGMIIWGGFEILTSATDAKKADAGKSKVTTAIMGFFIIFLAYWIGQILQIMLGVSVVNLPH